MSRRILVVLIASLPLSMPLGGAARAGDRAPLEKVREVAQACSVAAVSGDDKRVVACTLPQIVKRVGGANAMMDLLRNGREQMKAEHQELVAVTVYPPEAFTQGSGGDVFAILKSHTAMKSAEGLTHQSSYLVGVSTDKMKTWRFVDGVGLDDSKVRELLPTFPAGVKLPAKEEPVVEQ